MASLSYANVLKGEHPSPCGSKSYFIHTLHYLKNYAGKKISLGVSDWILWVPPLGFLGLASGLVTLAPQTSVVVWIALMAWLSVVILVGKSHRTLFAGASQPNFVIVDQFPCALDDFWWRFSACAVQLQDTNPTLHGVTSVRRLSKDLKDPSNSFNSTPTSPAFRRASSAPLAARDPTPLPPTSLTITIDTIPSPTSWIISVISVLRRLARLKD